MRCSLIVLVSGLLLYACGDRTTSGTDGGTADGGTADSAAPDLGGPSPGAWARAMGGSGQDVANAVVVDGQGEIFVTGGFKGTASFGGKTLKARGAEDVFVVKMDQAGSVLWAVSAGGKSSDLGSSIAPASTGGVLITGSYFNEATFGSKKLKAAGKQDIFVARLDSGGKFIWALSLGGNQGEVSGGIASAGNGESQVIGSFAGTATFGAKKITSRGKEDVFVVRISEAGKVVWVVQAGGAGSDLGKAIVERPGGGAVIAGTFWSKPSFGTIKLTSKGNEDLFVAQLDDTGTFAWASGGGGSYPDEARALAVDGAGNITLVGHFLVKTTVGAQTLKSAGKEDVLLVKVNPRGKFVGARSAGGTGSDSAAGVAVSSGGESFLTGWFQGKVKFGSKELTSSGDYDVFLARMDPAGDFVDLLGGGGAGEDIGTGVVLANKAPLVVGTMSGSASFGGQSLTSRGAGDALVWKVSPGGK